MAELAAFVLEMLIGDRGGGHRAVARLKRPARQARALRIEQAIRPVGRALTPQRLKRQHAAMAAVHQEARRAPDLADELGRAIQGIALANAAKVYLQALPLE